MCVCEEERSRGEGGEGGRRLNLFLFWIVCVRGILQYASDVSSPFAILCKYRKEREEREAREKAEREERERLEREMKEAEERERGEKEEEERRLREEVLKRMQEEREKEESVRKERCVGRGSADNGGSRVMGY